MTCSRPRCRCARRCARPWPPGWNWARSARWCPARDRPACPWPPARAAPSTWPRRCPARACAGRWPGPAGRCPARPSSARRGDRAAVNLISLEKAAKAYAHRTLLDGVSLGVSAGDRVGVVGRNGAGKSTLLGLLAGRVTPDSGRVAMAAGLRLGYLPQGDQLNGTVGEIVFGPGESPTPQEGEPPASAIMIQLLPQVSP